MKKQSARKGSGVKFIKPVKKLTRAERLIVILQQQRTQG